MEGFISVTQLLIGLYKKYPHYATNPLQEICTLHIVFPSSCGGPFNFNEVEFSTSCVPPFVAKVDQAQGS